MVPILEKTKQFRGKYLFPRERSGKPSGIAMTMRLRRLRHDVTDYDFHSGFRDRAAECAGYSHEVAGMALAHTIGNSVERAYWRGDLFGKRLQFIGK